MQWEVVQMSKRKICFFIDSTLMDVTIPDQTVFPRADSWSVSEKQDLQFVKSQEAIE